MRCRQPHGYMLPRTRREPHGANPLLGTGRCASAARSAIDAVEFAERELDMPIRSRHHHGPGLMLSNPANRNSNAASAGLAAASILANGIEAPPNASSFQYGSERSTSPHGPT